MVVFLCVIGVSFIHLREGQTRQKYVEDESNL